MIHPRPVGRSRRRNVGKAAGVTARRWESGATGDERSTRQAPFPPHILCPMITPSPTTKIDPKLCRGVLEQVVAESATRPGYVVISVPNTSYQIHLVGSARGEVGRTIVGTIRAKARRIDAVQSGGRFLEPVFGRPRRVQGSVIAIESGCIVVNAGVPIHVEPTDERQSAGDFQIGQFVSFDALDGATFTQG